MVHSKASDSSKLWQETADLSVTYKGHILWRSLKEPVDLHNTFSWSLTFNWLLGWNTRHSRKGLVCQPFVTVSLDLGSDEAAAKTSSLKGSPRMAFSFSFRCRVMPPINNNNNNNRAGDGRCWPGITPHPAATRTLKSRAARDSAFSLVV